MKLLRLHVISFGKLCDYRMELTDGLNLLCEENGWGKSTLAVFIKAMLYGLPASSKRDLDQNERKKYFPWQGGAYGGSMEFSTQKGIFRVERIFGLKESEDTFALFDLTTNLPSDAYSPSLGEELFGINADGFERSTYLSQREFVETNGNANVTARLGELLDAVDDIDCYDRAIEALEKQRKKYVLTGNRGKIAETDADILKKEQELEALQRKDETRERLSLNLEALTEELRVMQKRSGELRHLRERAVLHETRDSMQKELVDLKQQRSLIENRFDGVLPTDAEIAEANQTAQALSNVNHHLSLLSKPNSDSERLADLQKMHPNGIPAEEQIAALERENDTLLHHRARKEALEQSKDADGQRAWTRIPSPEELERAAAFLIRAEKAKEEANILRQRADAQKAKAPMFFLSLVAFLAGVCLLAYCMIFPQSEGMLLCLLGGIGCLLLGALLFLKNKRDEKAKDIQETERISSLLEEAKQRYNDVQTFLSAYGMRTDGDLSRNLQQLSIAATQQRSIADHHARISKDVAAEAAQIQEIARRLHVRIGAFVPLSEPKEDYRRELDALRHGVTELQRLGKAESQRAEEKRQAEEQRNGLLDRLFLFLRRYRTELSLSPSEHLQAIVEQCTEHRRLIAEIAKKQSTLDRFIKEKQLEQTEDSSNYDALLQEDKALEKDLRKRVTEKAELEAQLERLSLDTDRIPDVETELGNLKDRLAEYQASYNTIVHTQKHLEEAKNALSSRYLGRMQEAFRTFLSVLMGENTPEAFVDPSFAVSLRENGQTHTMSCFSQGWRDAVRFCIRLSLAEALYTDGEAPLLLLDDPFVNLDDRRLAAAKTLLESIANRYQIIYMVCRQE